ncbi:hypothetical protein NDU88_006895 [Pleurodeles waltl]|uniref:Uncharacterized protein n=1 Tax=Pleurodeles waltl TaxID=8319 RepID=A0AAV7TYX1_PLEWA|nr:hypothetical protein NDU88_006895 [Pleurodeles waltl]
MGSEELEEKRSEENNAGPEELKSRRDNEEDTGHETVEGERTNWGDAEARNTGAGGDMAFRLSHIPGGAWLAKVQSFLKRGTVREGGGGW